MKLITGLSILMLAVTAGCSSFAGNNNRVNSEPNVAASPAQGVSNAEANSETASTGGARSADAQAQALVADLYKQSDAKKSPFFQTKDRALVDKYFAKALADLIWKDAVASKGEVGAIDFDPLYNAQDVEIKNFSVGTANVKGDTATVPASFTNFGTKQTVTFTLRQTGTDWRISDIAYGDGHSLMIILKQAHQADKTSSAADGNFEGTYQVGDTNCTVKPIKMAFEVHWSKGSGAEIYFAQDPTTFVAGDDTKANRFVFTNDTLGDGTFYRKDGKTFPVKRIK